MSNRTGTQFKTDQAAADTALATAITTPTEANLTAAAAALRTVATNGRDSRAITTNDAAAQPLADSVASLANLAAQAVDHITRTNLPASGVTAQQTAERQVALKQIQTHLKYSGWETYQGKATTT